MEQDPWKIRRRWMVVTFVLCWGVIFYSLIFGPKYAEAAIQFAFTAIISILGCYVFGATWHDVRTGVKGGGRP